VIPSTSLELSLFVLSAILTMAANNELQRIPSYQYPAAHLGHLTEGQSNSLEKFKALLAKGQYYTAADPSRHIPASHDDETLL